ncbi:hypothetical protein SAMN04488105_114171 [Salipiger thiooxidans]|uniref:Uncharacterized protein n=1 Tax=Salipiger thiooxidans TaxID=282683 RepID=A0A1G7J9L4_9RHOB|nr:hypothetical protein SAMN04488105_114171 [Salipiger thiooxidans]
MTPNSAASSRSYVKDPRNDALESHVDRRVSPRADAGVPVIDAGFVAGDGDREGPRLIDEHMDRLYERGNAIMPEIGFSREEPVEVAKGPEGPPQASPRRAATTSAMASDEVRPGLSMPKRFTSPGTPCSSGPSMRKSAAGSPGPESLGRMPQ